MCLSLTPGSFFSLKAGQVQVCRQQPNRADNLHRVTLFTGEWSDFTFQVSSLFEQMPILASCCCCLATQSCPTLCDLMDGSTSGLPVPHHLLKFAQVHVRCCGDAIKSSHPLTLSSPSALSLSQHQGLLQRVGSLHQMTKRVELQL